MEVSTIDGSGTIEAGRAGVSLGAGLGSVSRHVLGCSLGYPKQVSVFAA